MDRHELISSFLGLAQTHAITIRDLVRLGETMLTHADVACSTSLGSRHREAVYLTFHVLGLNDFDPEHLDAKVTLAEIEPVLEMFDQRITKRIPSAYLTNEALYKGYRFYVDENVLIPRSTLGHHLQEIVSSTEWENDRVLDLGTGCGALGILVALMRPDIRIDLVDVSPQAVAVAKRNVDRFSLGKRARVFTSDLFENVTETYSLIIFNPPYVSEEQFNRAAEEVRHEPREAIVGGSEGLDLVIPTIQQADGHLTKSGTLAMEVGPSLEQVLRKRYPQLPLSWLHAPGRPWSGVFTLRSGYPAI